MADECLLGRWRYGLAWTDFGLGYRNSLRCGGGGSLMALTLEKEQRLEAAGLISFYKKDEAVWLTLAKQSYDYLSGNFPAKSPIRHDDVAKVLEPLIEVNEALRGYLNENKLKQKYWVRDFTDLVIDRTWTKIAKKGATDAEKEKR
jgi:hypothetical protein